LRESRIYAMPLPSRRIELRVLAGAPIGFLRRLLQPERVFGGEKNLFGFVVTH
jgi:hypothetical protein